MLHFLAGEADLIAYDFGSGGMELTFVFCKLKGAQRLSITASKSIGIVETDNCFISLELYSAEEWATGGDGFEPIVIVKCEGC